MTDEPKKQKDFKVEDRRTSVGADEEKAKTPGPGDEPAGAEKSDQEEKRSDETGDTLKVDFSTFIFSLFSSALIQLGDMADPVSGTMDQNLTAAKQTIDIIDILKEKTDGNLSEEESKLLENASAELKWKYLDTVKKKD